MKYTLFFKRYIFTKVFDPAFIGAKEGKDNQYLATLDHTATIYAQSNGCSKEEALSHAVEEFSQLENPEIQAQLREHIAKHKEAVLNSEAEWEQSGDKEKYPHLYLVDKLNEIMWEKLGLPKELLRK